MVEGQAQRGGTCGVQGRHKGADYMVERRGQTQRGRAYGVGGTRHKWAEHRGRNKGVEHMVNGQDQA